MNNPEDLEIYVSAHSQTGAPLFVNCVCHERFSTSGAVVFLKQPICLDFSHLPNVFHLSQISNDFHITNPTPSQDLSNCLFSKWCRYKTDFKKFGGQGIDLCAEQMDRNLEHFRRIFSFEWNPPKLNLVQEKSEKWICDVCKVVAKSEEQENYTKHGFTYCSIKCLAAHRKLNWAPLVG